MVSTSCASRSAKSELSLPSFRMIQTLFTLSSIIAARSPICLAKVAGVAASRRPPDPDALAAAYRDGATLRELAMRTSFSTTWISNALKAAGVSLRRSGPGPRR